MQMGTKFEIVYLGCPMSVFETVCSKMCENDPFRNTTNATTKLNTEIFSKKPRGEALEARLRQQRVFAQNVVVVFLGDNYFCVPECLVTFYQTTKNN